MSEFQCFGPLRFKPWPSLGPRKPRSIDPATGIAPISEWGAECGRGFVRDDRFAGNGDKVIKGTNRNKTRAARSLVERDLERAK